MPYFPDLNAYLHHSSQLIQAYPSTRITTKYSLPRKPNPRSKTKQPHPTKSENDSAHPKRDRSATLTLKTFHPDSGICLKYKTDKAAEVGRLLAGLGRLAKGEIVETPAVISGTDTEKDKMEVDSGVATPLVEDKAVPVPAAGTGPTAGKGGKKKKGKK